MMTGRVAVNEYMIGYADLFSLERMHESVVAHRRLFPNRETRFARYNSHRPFSAALQTVQVVNVIMPPLPWPHTRRINTCHVFPRSASENSTGHPTCSLPIPYHLLVPRLVYAYFLVSTLQNSAYLQLESN